MHDLPSPEKRLSRDDPFLFACSDRLPCFNTCCRNKDLTLTPYDVLRLRKALSLDSDTFLQAHTLYRQDPVSGFPVISLRMRDDAERRCPFVGAQGCSVYTDRPTACRLYPLARAVGRPSGAAREEEFFFLLDTPACLGVNEEHVVRLGNWLGGQEIEAYLRFNNHMLRVLFHEKRDRERLLNPEQLQKVIVACYNLDAFREFLSRTGFMERAGIDAQSRRKIHEDDEELLRFGHDFLCMALFP